MPFRARICVRAAQLHLLALPPDAEGEVREEAAGRSSEKGIVATEPSGYRYTRRFAENAKEGVGRSQCDERVLAAVSSRAAASAGKICPRS